MCVCVFSEQRASEQGRSGEATSFAAFVLADVLHKRENLVSSLREG